MKYPVFLPFIGLLLFCTCCNSQTTTKDSVMLSNSHTLLSNLTAKERDPNMMFYLNQASPGEDALGVLQNIEVAMLDFINSLPADKMSYAYGRGKWTVAEVLQHIISYEYIMTESALKIAGREVEKPFGPYTQASTAEGGKGRSKEEMLKRFKAARQETIRLYADLTEEELTQMGVHEWFPPPHAVWHYASQGTRRTIFRSFRTDT